MATHCYLKLLDKSGAPVVGEVVTPAYKDQIACADWSVDIGMQQDRAGAPGKASGRALGMSLFKFGKAPDKSSTRIMAALRDGEQFTQAIFTIYEELQGSEDLTEGSFHLVVKLNQVTVHEYQVQGETSEKEVTLKEQCSFQYQSVYFDYGGGVTLNQPPNAEAFKPVDKLDELVAEAKRLSPIERGNLINLIKRIRDDEDDKSAVSGKGVKPHGTR
ncbi:type VI secretion system tube protein Hcp [Aquariibacter albus]|uniref:Type VI secretion system tube protein Hcp n=1 Tax=Aquariibacter albus TaxID=2759899 RepID=A0A839HK37_9BURK|nr:type VI secretion system tube protein Hcp [Aquariibacter albus]MBB1163157.1 type VI secretion system tube protein Hcp [Aquariibacter albus]